MTIQISPIMHQNSVSDFAIHINHEHTPSTWVHLILEKAKEKPGDIIERHFLGAVLTRRHKNISIPNHPAHAGDRQTAREGDFTISKLVYHVTAMPSRNIIQKCAENVRMGLHPILLTPSEQKDRAWVLAQDEGIDKKVAIISLEDFVASNIMELAVDENKDCFGILAEIVQIYNRRLAEVETDLSLQIQVR